jgi:REP element-mobilizing transposase RayT
LPSTTTAEETEALGRTSGQELFRRGHDGSQARGHSRQTDGRNWPSSRKSERVRVGVQRGEGKLAVPQRLDVCAGGGRATVSQKVELAPAGGRGAILPHHVHASTIWAAPFKSLASQKESRIEEGHLLADHVHMLISIPPKHAVAHVIGFLKGKSAIHIEQTFLGRRQNFTANTSGLVGITSPQRVEMRKPSARTSRDRSRKTSAWTSWASGPNRPPLVRRPITNRFERFTRSSLRPCRRSWATN